MLIASPGPAYLTPVDLAVALGCRYTVVRAAMASLVIQPNGKAGRVSVFAAADVPAIRAALEAAGLIPVALPSIAFPDSGEMPGFPSL